MLVKDVMTSPVISVKPSATIAEAARLMLDHNISGLPVVDTHGVLRGMVTEGDFLQRAELGTEIRRARWLEYLVNTGKIAEEYVLSHGRRVGEVMQDEAITCGPDDSLDVPVKAMLQHRIKRLPVVEGNRVVGIISRSDLLRALVPLVEPDGNRRRPDQEIVEAIEARMKKVVWAGSLIEPNVKDGVVTLEGTVFDQRQQQAIHVLVENIPGVKAVVDQLLWIEPMSGTALNAADRRPV
jgi:CBS-domain-containing membrane protein